jgi:peptide subunit release factor 1 (eRF1)
MTRDLVLLLLMVEVLFLLPFKEMLEIFFKKITVELPKKHGRGGQSANRFARLREEKRHTYVGRVSELAT